MATTGRTSDYDDELLVPPADDDLLDISVLVSTGPDVWVSTKMRYAEIKGASSSIPNDIIPVGNAAGTGIEASTGKAGAVSGYPDDFAIAHEDFFNDSEFLAYQGQNGISYISSKTGESVRFSVGLDNKMTITDSGVQMSVVGSEDVTIGVSLLAGLGAKLEVRGEDDLDATPVVILSNFSGDNLFQVTAAGTVTLLNGTGIDEFSTDGTLAGDSDDAVPTEKAVKTYVDAQSGGGWLGSETRIKIAPWDVVSYNDKDGVSIQNNGGVVNDAAAKITTMVTGVFIPTGYKATAFKINASANIAVELFESQIWDSTEVSKGSGNANTEINITNVNSTATNYLTIIIVEAGNDIYGGYITIEKI
jgi:hypothetical protein